MGTREEARRALDALDNQFVFEGLEAPMVVKWMDAPLQRKRREVHLAALRQGHMPPTRSRGGREGEMGHMCCTAGHLAAAFAKVADKPPTGGMTRARAALALHAGSEH